jgi:hypothetical protein
MMRVKRCSRIHQSLERDSFQVPLSSSKIVGKNSWLSLLKTRRDVGKIQATRLVRQTERGVSRPHDSALFGAIHNRRRVAGNAHQLLHEDCDVRACVA